MNANLKERRRDEQGQALVLVLVISVLLVGLLAVAFSTSAANLSLSTRYGSSSQASLAALGGLNAEYATMKNATSYSSFPCGLSGTVSVSGAASSYSVGVQYYANSTSLTCPPATPPTSATLTSTGRAPYGSPTVMQENLAISASQTPASAALGYAIFTEGNLTLYNDAQVDEVSTTNPPNIYSGQTLTCDNGSLSEGNLITYQPIDLANNCQISGGLTAAGQVTLENSVGIGGNLTSYGGGITMTGNPLVGGNAMETNGNISLSNSATIDGNAAATGTITKSGGSKIVGTITQNDSALSSQSMPTATSFPSIDTTLTDWSAAGWTIVQVPSASYPTCASYFQNIASESGPQPPTDPFMSQLYTATTKTLIYAPTCSVTYSSSHTFGLNADITLWVSTLTLNNSNTFESTSSTVRNFSILASPTASCSTSQTDVTLTNFASFTATVDAFIYTPGQVSYSNAPSMSGQILACNGFNSTNAFVLNFVPGAAALLPGLSSSSTPPTETVLQKFVLKG
jgi:hypothetical protein